MSDAEGCDGEEPVSPCIGLCQMDDETGLCRGCYRTLEEIAGWSSASERDKRVVIEANRLRRELHDPDADLRCDCED
ncbi:MAG: DUF1289 domain-containing protein [Rhodocyclaceae bacterium]|nr:DUF1289 domain-containing protein [Rhodocyclaceae bacterium]